MKKVKTALAMLLAMMMLMTGCATTQPTASPSPSAATPSPATAPSTTPTSAEPSPTASEAAPIDMSGVTLRVQYTFPADSNLLGLAGLDNTPYKLELVKYTGSDLALQAIATDNLDLARSSEIPPLYAALTEGGGNFSIVAVEKMYMGKQALIIAPESPIKSVADLKGQKVGYVKSTSAQYFLEVMLEQAGLQWSDIQPTPLSPSDGLAALLGGEISAMALYGNQVTACEQAGGSVLQDATSLLSGNTLWEANNLSLKDPAKCAAIVDYLQRTEKLEAWIRDNHEAYANVMADKYYGMTVPDFIKYLEAGEAVRENHVFITTDEDIAALQSVSDAFLKMGALEKEVKVAPLFTDQLSADIQAALDAVK